MFCLSIPQLIDIWVVPTFCLLRTMLLCASLTIWDLIVSSKFAGNSYKNSFHISYFLKVNL